MISLIINKFVWDNKNMVQYLKSIGLALVLSVGMGSLGIAESESTEPDTLEKNNSKPLLPIPNAGQIIMSLPICSLLSSLGQRCKVYSTSAQTTHRLFTDQKIKNIEIGSSEASIETDDWYYSIGNVEENDSGFTFDFTDDALLATYLTQSTYYVELDKGSMTWVIVGDELGYNSGRDEENLGKYISYDSPIMLPITQ